MSWFILTLACIILWSVSDILFRASFYKSDSLAYHKSFVWIGIVMAFAAVIMSTWSNTLLDSLKTLISEAFYLVPLCLIYTGAWFIGLLGNKHLDASVVSPLENIEGAMAAVIIYFYYLHTGYIHPDYHLGILDVIAAVSVIIGVVLLAKQEQELMLKESQLSDDKKRHRLGALALFFPLVYTLIDVFSIAEINDIVFTSSETTIPAIDFFVFECTGFVVVAICIWLYMAIVKKYRYNPFEEEELIRCGAATSETLGIMAFLFASSINPILTAPIVSLYCLVTLVLARIFLKERLTKKQYLSLAFVIAGILLLGISGLLSV